MHRTLALALLCASLVACTQNDLDDVEFPGPAAASARVDLVVHDAPIDELVAFLATVEGLRLGRDDGTSTDPLLAAPLRVEFAGLRERSLWLASFELEEGTYESVRLRFTPGSAAARALDGRDVSVDALDNLLVAPFEQPLTVTGGGYARIELDLDLRASLAGDVQGGSLTFRPEGLAKASDGSVPLVIEDLDALVLARDLASATLTVSAQVADARDATLRSALVRLEPGALLLDALGAPVAQAALFLTLLTPGLSVVELEGFLGPEGELLARCVGLEDQNGLSGTRFPVEIEGRVVGRPSPSLLRIVVREVTRGALFAEPVLAGLGRNTIDLLIAPAPPLASATGGLPTMDDVRIGADVEAKFTFFSAEPFQPARLVLSDGPTPAAAAAAAPLRSIRLDVAQRPALAPADVPAGAAVWSSSGLSLVRPGLLVEARVAGVDRAARRIAVHGARIAEPFGGDQAQGQGPFTLVVEPEARFLGLAGGLDELARAFEVLAPDASLVLEVRGLAGEGPYELRAWEVRSRLR